MKKYLHHIYLYPYNVNGINLVYYDGEIQPFGPNIVTDNVYVKSIRSCIEDEYPNKINENTLLSGNTYSCMLLCFNNL